MPRSPAGGGDAAPSSPIVGATSRRPTMSTDTLTPDSWLAILRSAYALFADAEARGFGTPPFSLGGETLLEAIIPYATGLPHAEGMIAKVRDFIGRQTGQHR